MIETRRQHKQQYRVMRESHDKIEMEIGLWRHPLMRVYFNFRYHPINSLRSYFWHFVPHKPEWELDSWMTGELNFNGWEDCYSGGYFKQCRRCGTVVD